MKFPTMQAVKEDIENGFNKKYQEHIKDTHIEAVYEAVERVWRRENDVSEESTTKKRNDGGRVQKSGKRGDGRIPQKEHVATR